MDINKLKSIYELYGYKVLDFQDELILCLYEEGRYFGADIILLNGGPNTLEKAENIRLEYSKSGYASNIKNYKTANDAELELYKSFFSYTASKKRNKKKYSEFVTKQAKNNGGYPYKYINSPYIINGNIASNNGITNSINQHLKSEQPQLIIIEAAAGYGKTCTSYELLEKFLNSDSCEIPLLTELSRNRGANIFRYILLDEIDRQYPNLDSKLVKHEIQTGRIPLIIDGFDELIKKSDIVISDKHEVFKEVETMLDTIGQLLDKKAKIILTTRKTAIFSGNEFKNWAEKWNNRFNITRYAIEVPRIKDWIGKEKLGEIKNNNIPVEYIANPVLLTYLRNLSEIDFKAILEEPNSIVNKYFNSLLKREMTRQDLRINPENQYVIFKNTVKMLIEFDSSTEKQSFLKDIIYDQNKKIIDEALKLYSGNTDIDILINKLANHALLDRKGVQDDQIGFINDFVFGTFIGEIMGEISPEIINNSWSSYMVELGVTAYKVQNVENKEKLWDKIDSLKHRFEQHSLFNFDIILKNSIQRHYKNEEFNSISIYNIKFQQEFNISRSVFIDCLFKKCYFEFEVFEDVTFLNCAFIDCGSENNIKLEDMINVKTINCTEDNSDILVFYKTYPKERSDIENTENQILNEIFKGENKINSLLRTVSINKKKIANAALKNLIDEDYVEINGLTVKLATNKISKVKIRINMLKDNDK